MFPLKKGTWFCILLGVCLLGVVHSQIYTDNTLKNRVDACFDNGTWTNVAPCSDIATWDVSTVTNMAELFIDKTNFNEDISNWDVSSVTSMRAMFNKANAFNQPLNHWNTSAVTTMKDMFNEATSFNQPLNTWNVSSVSNMEGMFYKAYNFNQTLSCWDFKSGVSIYAIIWQTPAFHRTHYVITDDFSPGEYIPNSRNKDSVFSDCLPQCTDGYLRIENVFDCIPIQKVVDVLTDAEIIEKCTERNNFAAISFLIIALVVVTGLFIFNCYRMKGGARTPRNFNK